MIHLRRLEDQGDSVAVAGIILPIGCLHLLHSEASEGAPATIKNRVFKAEVSLDPRNNHDRFKPQ